MKECRKMKVIRVDKKEFELEDGRIFEHIEPLDEIPTLEEFQKLYDECYAEIIKKLENIENETK